MNEITALRTYGPDAPEAPPAVLNAARDRLHAEFAAPPARLPARRRTLLVAAAATLVTGAAAGLAVRPSGPAPVAAPVTLVAAQIPEFPIALRPRPAGLAAPKLSFGGGRFLAVYLHRDGTSDVYLSVWDQRPTAELVPSRAVTVGGRPAELYDVRLPDNPHTVEVVWQRAPGQWVSLIGKGAYASAPAVLALAATVVDQPQPVPLRVRLAPAGWKLFFFKDDTILKLVGENPDESLTVQVVDRPTPDLFHQVMGARDEQRVRVGGRTARLIRTSESWFLQSEVPGGVVNLQAPLRLTAEQVVAIAEQVSVVPAR